MKRALVVAGAAAVAVAALLIVLPRAPVPIPSPADINATRIDVMASNLEVPWAIDIADDGRIFFTERAGRIQVIDDGRVLNFLNLADQVASTGEGGMLGLALDPEFGKNGIIYVYYTYADDSGALWNKVSRLSPSGSGYDQHILVDKIPGAEIHDGGRMKFGPDGKLYITTGDAAQSGLAQDPASLAGKILRIDADGSIPGDNPFTNSPVYSYGHRNPQGLAWHPVTGQLYAMEHGPIGNDEINIIRAGGNYGWPEEQCGGPLAHIDSIACYQVSVAPSGAVFYSSDVSKYANNLFFGTLRGEHIERVVLGQDGTIENRMNFLSGFGRIRDIVQGPDGSLYIATSNRDGRALPAEDDDKILRITLAR